MADDDDETPRDGTRREGEERLPRAHRRSARWPGWVWAIPLAALVLAGWLVAEEWGLGSEDVTRFARAEGVSAGAAVRYRGTKVGRVEQVRLDDDLEQVRMVLSTEEPVSGRLGEGSRFWIERPELAQGDVMGLLSGAHVEVEPVEGRPARVFEGLAAPPALAADRPGRTFVLRAEEAGGVSRDAPVLFRGVEVGRVLGVRLDPGTRRVEVPVAVAEPYAGLVRQDSE